MFDFLTNMFDFIPVKVSIWFTAIWSLGVGALLGLVVLLMFWGVLAIVSRRAAAEVPRIVSEGVLRWIFFIVVALAGFGIVGSVMFQKPGQILSSVGRLPVTGKHVYMADIPSTGKKQPIEVSFRNSELQTLKIETSVPITIDTRSPDHESGGLVFDMVSSEKYSWNRKQPSLAPFLEKRDEKGKVIPEQVTQIFVTNDSGVAAEVMITAVTVPPAGQDVSTIPWTAVSVVCLFALYFLQRVTMPKTAAIAHAMAKSEMSQPVFLICLGLGLFLVFFLFWIPYGTFGEDIKMYKNTALSVIMILSIVAAVWAASNSIADEIEGRTALTVLSKPISRRQFILGKFLGIVWVVAVMFIILGVFFLICTAYKPIYDAREVARQTPSWQECHHATIQIVPALALAFMEAVILAAISVAISTRLSMMANFSICFAIYALGHLTPLIVQSSVSEFEPVAFIGLFLATILPVLENFSVQAAVAGGQDIPANYLAWALLYCILYSTVAMLLALVLFEDRDLA